MMEDRVVYQERWHWATWLSLILWGSMLACIAPLLAGWGTDSPLGERLFLAGAIVMVYVFLFVFFGGTTIQVRTNHVQVFLGTVPLVRKRISYGDIVSLEPVRYHPIKEFGGWGVRGWGKKQAWSARGDQALVVTLVTEKQLYLGTDTPQRLEERVRAAAGAQLGENA